MDGSTGSQGLVVKLRVKFGLLAALLATLPLAAVGYLLIDVNAEAVSVLSRELQASVVDDVARTIDQEFVEAQDGLDAVGRVLTDGELGSERAIPIALALVSAHEGLDHVAVYDAQGERIDTILEAELGNMDVPPTLDASLRAEAERWNAAMGVTTLIEGRPRVPLVVPLRVGERLTGYALTMVALTDVQERIERIAEGRFPGQRDSIFVIDERFRVVAHADPARAVALEDMTGRGILAGVDGATLRADFSRAGEYVTDDGREMVGSMGTLAGRSWAVVVQIPADVAYATLGRMRTIVIITVVIVSILALLIGVFAAHRIVAPLSRLTAFAHELAQRHFEKRVIVESGDELEVLAGAMSRAAADLQASEEKLQEEAAIRSDLGRYLPEELVDKVVRREQNMSLGGTKREVTILFADVVGFTPFTESHDPEDVVTILNELFTILTGIVFRHGGTVDKFIGDCVMALWGAPTEHEDHAARALNAAEDMMRWLEMGNVAWQERFGVTIQLAVGVHSGEAIVGNIGSKSRMEYTAIGDAVNVAARLEGIARPQQILVSDTTRQLAGDGFDYLDAGTHKLPGHSGEMQLYEVQP